MSLAIRFNCDNVLHQRVGSEGLAADELDRHAADSALQAFESRVQAGEVGFPHLPDDTATARAIEEFAAGMRPHIDDLVLVGIGGSALGASALDIAIRGPHPLRSSGKRAGPRLVVLDNIDPGVIHAALDLLNPKRTAVCVVAKSGSTAETLATFLIVHAWMKKSLGKHARERIIAVTGPSKGDLLAVAREEQYPLFFIPENVGGRFSVLSPVGLVPAALIGLDIRRLLQGARDANAVCRHKQLSRNPALTSALVHWALDRQRNASKSCLRTPRICGVPRSGTGSFGRRAWASNWTAAGESSIAGRRRSPRSA